MPRPWIHRLAAIASAALLTASVAGCRSSVDPTASPERLSRSDAGVELASHGVETKTRIHRVFGRLPDRRRKAVRSEVGAVIDGWWEAAYLGGTYPRSSFPAAFPGFTRGAEARARADKALLTNETQGPSIDSVTAQHRSVVVDVLATGGQARSVTAHVVLRFETTGEKAGTTTVRGRLFLTRRSSGWKVFGYDVSKGAKR